ncbi:MAG TPA: bifunctional diaminohydroxyphosphoribosylaminopyrimidine deaminase/5-amino-6-(5-phosphoribosylamino)uracil reductase RibD [Candidatus Polarisedimenticolia bacterium]|nr:bifunctional diaminohydroxyphosphoribosylaminopyrimidine deaminase/5-amino-6-(5-phosphoribosylamino)uracil reductase RibD [Candidatus Polarisedimenticolia bacterium]
MSAQGTHAPPVAERHRRFLTACLDLARLGEGETSPNPMVGALVVKEDRILGQGYHRRAGDPHAEIEALGLAGEESRGATLYVSLEPCVHHGRTPPCTDRLIQAGIVEVIACMKDPDPRVNGRGFERLRSAGVRVSEGTLREEAMRLNEKFVRFVTTGRPYVTLKAAMTLDGKIAAASGESRWITSEAARQEGHRLRYIHDAILVGVQTILADDPLLTARWGAGKALLRVILDSRLRTPPEARILSRTDGGSALVYTLRGSPLQARKALEARPGVEVVEVDERDSRVDLERVLEDLGRRRIVSVLIEGGGQVLGRALSSGAADHLAVFIAPKILGSAGIPAFAGSAAAGLSDAIPVYEWRWREVGGDLLVEGSLRRPIVEEAASCSRA